MAQEKSEIGVLRAQKSKATLVGLCGLPSQEERSSSWPPGSGSEVGVGMGKKPGFGSGGGLSRQLSLRPSSPRAIETLPVGSREL